MKKVLDFDLKKNFREAAASVNGAELAAFKKLSDTADMMEKTLGSIRDCLGLFVEWNNAREKVSDTYDIKIESMKKRK